MLDKRYIAGFFDGEGCVYVQYKSTKLGHKYNLQVHVTQKNPEILYEIQSVFGGEVRMHCKKSFCYEWRVCSANALPFLLAIQPFVFVKKYQVDLAIKFLLTIRKKNYGAHKALDANIHLYRKELMSSIKLAKTVSPSKILEIAGNREPAIRSQAQFNWEGSETIMRTSLKKDDGIVRHSEESEKTGSYGHNATS